MSDIIIELPEKKVLKLSRLLFWLMFFFVAMAGVCGFVISYLNQAPSDFTSPTTISIESGAGIKMITREFEEKSVVRSGTLLYFTIVLFFEPTEIKASTYFFDKPLSTYEVARQLVSGDFDTDLVRFTHFEGERATSIASRAKASLTNFNSEKFLELAVPLEGKLYPDTYFVPADFTAEELVELMLRTFIEATEPLQELIASSSLSFKEIIVLASIIEREANSPDSMRMVSGILQNRLAIDMPLQADASIEYILDKPLGELLPEDLKIDSPYNTYLNRGLPPTPIGNPGINSIMAVLEPTETEYFYYITDADGVFHYAETYDEHLDNIELYLR